MMGIFQEDEKLQVKCSSNIIFFLEFAWILANIAAAQMLQCVLSTLTFQQLPCVSSIVSFWALGNRRMLEANPSKTIKKKKINALDFKEQQNT